MGYDYSDLKGLSLDHRFIGGNHDHWDVIALESNYLGRYGSDSLGGEKFFYVSGAFSIDKHRRQEAQLRGWPKTWFDNEELSYPEGKRCIKQYEKEKPDIVFSHDCPHVVSGLINRGNTKTLRSYGYDPQKFVTITQIILQQMFEIHKPKYWVFGHHHQDNSVMVEHYETLFVCLNELSTLTIDNGKLIS